MQIRGFACHYMMMMFLKFWLNYFGVVCGWRYRLPMFNVSALLADWNYIWCFNINCYSTNSIHLHSTIFLMTICIQVYDARSEIFCQQVEEKYMYMLSSNWRDNWYFQSLTSFKEKKIHCTYICILFTGIKIDCYATRARNLWKTIKQHLVITHTSQDST